MPAAAVTLAQGANKGCGAGLGRSTVARACAAVAQGGWAKPGLTDTVAQGDRWLGARLLEARCLGGAAAGAQGEGEMLLEFRSKLSPPSFV